MIPQFKEKKLDALLSLAQLDPNLLFLISIIGYSNFGTLVKTMGGLSISIPSVKDIQKVIKKIKGYSRSFQKILKVHGKNTTLTHLASLGKAIDSKDFRTATKVMITKIVFEEYIRNIYEDETFKFTMEEFEDLKEDDKIGLYALSIKELEARNNLLHNINILNKKSK